MGDICKYGEPSVSSRTNTREFDEGYERTFGPSSDEIRAPRRATYVYRGGRMVEQGGPDDTGCYEPEDEARNHIVSDLYMVGVHATDGTDIGSRRKRREYMRDRGLADFDDFKGYWAKKEQERKVLLSGEKRDPARRHMIGKALYEASKKGSR